MTKTYPMGKFIYNFAAAFGILDLLLLLLALIMERSIKVEGAGLIVLLAVSLIWAIIMSTRAPVKTSNDNEIPDDQKLKELQAKIAQAELTKKLYKDGGLPFTE